MSIHVIDTLCISAGLRIFTFLIALNNDGHKYIDNALIEDSYLCSSAFISNISFRRRELLKCSPHQTPPHLCPTAPHAEHWSPWYMWSSGLCGDAWSRLLDTVLTSQGPPSVSPASTWRKSHDHQLHYSIRQIIVSKLRFCYICSELSWLYLKIFRW